MMTTVTGPIIMFSGYVLGVFMSDLCLTSQSNYFLNHVSLNQLYCDFLTGDEVNVIMYV